MVQQFLSVCSLFRVFVEATRHEVLKGGGPFTILQPRSFLGYDKVKDLLLRLTNIRGLTVSKLESEDTEAPDVNLDVILGFTSDELGSHPADCTHFARTLRFFLGKLCGIAEVSKFEVTCFTNENVI
jgi:hypothetical protein